MMSDESVLWRASIVKTSFDARSSLLIALAVVLVFALDCLTPLGVAVPFLYILILWVTLVRVPRHTPAVTVASSTLTVIGLFLSPEGELFTDVINSAITLFALWFLTYFGIASRKALEMLGERERELTDLVENAPVGIHWIDLDGTIRGVNQRELDMLGYTKEDYVGRSIVEFHVDPKAANDFLKELNANAPLRNRACRLRHKDGSIRHVLVSCNIYRKNDRLMYGRGFMQDITDRVHADAARREREQRAAANARLVEDAFRLQAERAVRAQSELLERRVIERTAQLRNSEDRLNFSLQTSHIGVWDLDLVDHSVYRTLEHDRIFGYDTLLPQWTYEQFLDHVLQEDRGGVDHRYRQATVTEAGWNFECRIRRADGEVRWIFAAGEHQRDATGQMRRMTGIVQDITERKLAEQALRDSKGKLRLAFEDRERLSRDLHDNIIQAVYAVGMQLEACQRQPQDHPKDIAQHLRHAVAGLNGVIRDVRCYISGPEPEIKSQSDLCTELAKLVKTIDTTGVLHVRLKVDPLAAARLAPAQVEHVLQIAREALSNALKHSQAREGRLSLRRAGNRVRLEVRDDGVGFEPQTQGVKGTGLRNMESRVRQMGAKLNVSSSPRRGTRIVLMLPETKEVYAAKYT